MQANREYFKYSSDNNMDKVKWASHNRGDKYREYLRAFKRRVDAETVSTSDGVVCGSSYKAAC
jgi:hypothetical protein